MATSTLHIQQAKKNAVPGMLAETGTISAACRAAGVDRTSHYRWLETDPEYAAAIRDAEQQFIHKLEAEMYRRGVEGVDEPVYDGGKLVGHKRKYSDTLLIFALKGAAPAKYKDNPANLTVNNNTLIIEHVDDWRG